MPSVALFPFSRERGTSISGNSGIENDRDSRALRKREPGNASPRWYIKPLIKITVKPLAALKVGDFACKIVMAPFILANSSHTIPMQSNAN